MIHVGRINYELGLFNANFDSRNKDILPDPVLKRQLEIPEARHWVLEEDPVFSERTKLEYFKTRRFEFGRFGRLRCSRINLENLK
jgi:hypothetical protein